jgi:type II secretory pathway predicted ATPase ExeA
MDYLRYWSLLEKPFARDSAKRFFLGPPQREAMARLHYTVAGGISCAVLTSPAGCGMTSLLRHASRTCGFGDCAVEMMLTQGKTDSPLEVFQSLARSLRISWSPESVEADVREAISATSRQFVRTVWLIDGATECSAKIARSLIDRDDLFTAVLGSTPELATCMALSLGACPLRIELPPLDLEDTGRFVTYALHTAGCSKPIFADPAIVRLHEISSGKVKQLTQLAELALLVGAANRVSKIQSELLEAVHEELVQAA